MCRFEFFFGVLSLFQSMTRCVLRHPCSFHCGPATVKLLPWVSPWTCSLSPTLSATGSISAPPAICPLYFTTITLTFIVRFWLSNTGTFACRLSLRECGSMQLHFNDWVVLGLLLCDFNTVAERRVYSFTLSLTGKFQIVRASI